jgi:hypothetical protein
MKREVSRIRRKKALGRVVLEENIWYLVYQAMHANTFYKTMFYVEA